MVVWGSAHLLLLRAYNIYNCRLRYVAVSTSSILVFLRFRAGDIYATNDGERVPLRQIMKKKHSVFLDRIAQPTTSSVCFPQTQIFRPSNKQNSVSQPLCSCLYRCTASSFSSALRPSSEPSYHRLLPIYQCVDVKKFYYFS